MNKLIFALLCLVSTNLLSQSFEIQNELGDSINNDTLKFTFSITETNIEIHLGLKNESGNNIESNVTRYEENVLGYTSNYFCWGSCTGVTASGSQPVVTPNGFVNINSGTTIPSSNGFTLYYDPNYLAGTSLFKIKFFDRNNTIDSSIVYIQITTINDLHIQDKIFENTSVKISNNQISVNTDLSNFSSILYDINGKELFITDKKVIKLNQTKNGIYFLKVKSKSHFKVFKLIKN